MAGRLRVTLKKSMIGFSEKQRNIVRGLGLRRRHQVIDLQDSKAIRGMIKKIEFMLDVEEH